VRTIDTNLGLKPQARAVLHMLDEGLQVDEPSVFVMTWAWYNGRERGFALTVGGPNLKALVVVCNEARSGDDIVVDRWTRDSEAWMDPPTAEEFTDGAYAARKSFRVGNVGAAADYIKRLVAWYEKQAKKIHESDAKAAKCRKRGA